MTAIVAGQGLGWMTSSLGQLGAGGQLGQAGQGRSGERVYVNAGTGNLVVQQQDEWLMGAGPDVALLRTYNSLGGADGDNNDQWRLGLSRRITGYNATDNTVRRMAEDGSEALYRWDAARNLYVNKDGTGAFDTLAWSGSAWTYTDGDTQRREVYEVTNATTREARLKSVTEVDGKSLTLGYSGALLTSVKTASGETLFIDYDSAAGKTANITQLRTVKADGTQTRVRYGYDSANRLSTVTVDLTPADGTVADGQTYVTTYTYVDATSRRLDTLVQSDGSKLDFDYDDSGRVKTIKETVGGQVLSTSFDYATPGITRITDALSQRTDLSYDPASGRLLSVKTPAVGTTQLSREYRYTADGQARELVDGQGNVTTYGYDANGNRHYERDAVGNVVERQYGSRNELLKETRYRQGDPDGAGPQLPTEPMSTRYAYDAQLQLRFVVSADGRVVEHRYDSQGQRTSTLQHGGGVYTAPASDLAALEAWAAGVAKAGSQRTDYSYDFRGQLSTTTTYGQLDASGAGVLDGTQSVTHYVYDPSGLLLQSIEARGDELATRNTDWALQQRKALGLVDDKQAPLQAEALTAGQKQALKQRYVTTYQYDGLNRLVKQTDAAGQSTLTVYNDRLRQTRVTLANGLVQLSLFDESGRLLKLEQQDPSQATPSLGATTYEYDKLGRLVKATDPTGVSRYTLYDRASRKVGEVDGEGALTEYFYDRNNRLTGTRRYATPLSPAMLQALKADPTGLGLPANILRPGMVRWDPGTTGAATGFGFGEGSHPQGSLSGEKTLWMSQTGTAAVSAHLRSAKLVVSAGKRYEVSAYTGAQRAAVSLEVEFFDAQGARIGSALVPQGGTAVNNAEKAGGAHLADHKRLWGFVTAPAGASSAEVVVRKAPTAAGQADSIMFLARTQFGEVMPDATSGAIDVRPPSSGEDRVTYRIYDAAGRLARTLQSSGSSAAVVDYRYDGADRLIETVACANRLTSDIYALIEKGTVGGVLDLELTKLSTTAADESNDDRRTRQFYSAGGLLLGSLDGDGYLTENSYDAAGRLVLTRRYARVTAASLWAAGSLDQLRPAADHANDTLTAYFYDAKGQLLSRFDAQSYSKTSNVHQGYLSTYQYDGAGRKAGETRHASLAAYAVDHPAVAPTVAEHPQDRLTAYEYDTTGRLVREDRRERAQAAGLVTQLQYDVMGRLIQTVVGAGLADARTTQKRYDLQGRLVGELGGEGQKALAALGSGATAAQIEAVWQKWGSFHSHDAAGRRIATVTPNAAGSGDKTIYYYDGESRLTHAVNALGEVTQYHYNSFGEQVRETRYGDRLASTAAGAGGLKAAIQTAVGALKGAHDTMRREFDRQGLLTAWYDAQNRRLGSHLYNAFGEVTKRTDYLRDGSQPVQRTTDYRYNRRGLLETKTEDPLGQGERITKTLHDAFGRAIQTTDARGGVVQQRYDRLGRQVGSTDAVGVTRSTTYDAFSRVVTSTDGQQGTTTYTYDPATRRMTLQTPEGIKQVTEQNAFGERVSVSDGRTRTEYDYDRDGRLTATRVENQATGVWVTRALTTYDAAGRVFETGDGRGTVTRTTYDAAGRVLTRVVDPSTLKLTTTYRYDTLGRATWLRDANGVWTQTEYDADGRVTAVVVDPKCGPDWVSGSAPDNPNGLALRTEYALDLGGRLVRLTEGAGSALPKVTEYVYDSFGRRIEEVVAPGSLDLRTVYTYDKNDNVTAKTDARGFVTRYVYDAEDRLLWTVDATGAVRRNEYDAEGRITRATAYAVRLGATQLAALSLTASEADLTTGLLATDAGYASHPGNQVEVRIHDRDGRLTHSVDALGYVTRREYDASNNLVKQTRYVKAVQGALAPVVNPVGVPAHVVTFAAPTVIASNDPVPAVPYVVLDAQDQTEQTFYDAANRAIFSVDAAGGVTQRRYDGNGNVVETRRHFNPMTGTTVVNGLLTVTVAASNENDRVQRSVYDRGNRELFSIDAENAVTQYEYDGLGRVKSATRFANRLQGAYAEGEAPEVVNAGGTPKTSSKSWIVRSAAGDVERDARTASTYDKAGRLIEVRNAEDGLTTRVYDESGRLKELNEGVGTAAQRRTWYHHDAAGRVDEETRFGEGSETVVTRYLLDKAGNRERIISPLGVELAETDSPWAKGVRAGTKFGTRSWTTFTSAEKTELQAMYSTVQVFDALGRVTQVTDAQGGVTATQYDAFGNAVKVTDPNGNVGYFYFDRRNQGVLHVNPDAGVVETTYTAFGTVNSTTRYYRRVEIVGDPTRRALNETTLPRAVDAVPSSGAYILRHAALDQVTRIGYDRLNRQTSITDGEGKTERIEYDRLGNKVRYTNKVDGVFTYTHYRDGRVKTETSPEKAAQQDAAGKVVMADVITTHVYDTRGNLRRKTEATGLREERVTEFQYDRLDRQVKQIGQVTRVFDAASGTESDVVPTLTTRYDAHGNVVETVDARGGRTLYYYDSLGRQIGKVDAGRTYTTWTYDKAGNKLSQITYANAVQAVGGAELSSATRPQLLSSAPAPGAAAVYLMRDRVGAPELFDRETFYTYDKAGRQTGTRIPNMPYIKHRPDLGQGRHESYTGDLITSITYDAAGNAVKQMDGKGNVTRFYYDQAGNKVAQLDAALHLVKWDRDAQGNVWKETRYANAVKGITVNDKTTLGEIIKPNALVGDAADRITIYSYDKLNRVLSETRKGVQTATFDASGKPVPVVADAVTRYLYDGLNNVIRKTDAAQATTDWRFDKAGRQVREERALYVDFEGEVVRPTTDKEYDALGNVRREIRRGKDNGSEADDRIAVFGYDKSGWLVSQTDAESGVTKFHHDAAGNVTRKVLKGRVSADETVVDDTTVYVYDLMNREVMRKDLGSLVVRETRYNAFGELTGKATRSENAPLNWQETAAYDRAGRAWKTNTGDGVTKVHGYDSAGNAVLTVTSKTDVSALTLAQVLARGDAARQFAVFDARNQVTDIFDAHMDGANGSAIIKSNEAGQSVFVSDDSAIQIGPQPTSTETGTATSVRLGDVAISATRIAVTQKTVTPRAPIGGANVAFAYIKIDVPPTWEYGDGNVIVQVSNSFNGTGPQSHTLRVGPAGGQLTIDNWGIIQTTRLWTGQTTLQYTVTRETAQGSIVLASTSVLAYVSMEPHVNNFDLQGPKKLYFNGQPESANRLVLFYRPEGSQGPYEWLSVPKMSSTNAGGMDGKFAHDWSALQGKDYEFHYVALNSAGAVVNKRAGSLRLSNPSAPSVVQESTGIVGLPGRGVLHNDGWLHILEQGDASDLTLRYREAGSGSPWKLAGSEQVLHQPKIFEDGRTPGWFALRWDSFETGKTYEFDLQAYRDGRPINRAYAEFRRDSSGNPTISAFTLPATVHFSELKDVRSLKVEYRPAGSSGPYREPPAEDVRGEGPGVFSWNATDLVADKATDYEYEVIVTAYGDGDLVKKKTTAKLRLGPNARVVEVHADTLDQTVLRLTPPQSGVASVQLRYRLRNSADNYTTLMTTRSGTEFRADLRSLGLPHEGSVEYEYVYDALDAANNPLGRSYGTFRLQPDGGSAERLDWVIFAPTDPETQQIHRRVTYNAFGEVASETDGRGNVSRFFYNTLGSRLRQEAPKTWVTYANGFKEEVLPTTLNHYDLTGRLIGVTDANDQTQSQTWLSGGASAGISSERHAFGSKRYGYDIFGDKRYSLNELARDAGDLRGRTDYRYDRVGRLVEVRYPERAAGTPGNGGAAGTRASDHYAYDAAGQRISHTNALGATERTWYDSQGRVTKTSSFAGHETRYQYVYRFDIALSADRIVGGWEKTVTDATKRTSIEHTDLFGRLTWKQDLGGHQFTYTYNFAGQLVAQTGSTKQNIAYEYYANGYIKSIWDKAIGAFTSYEYDKAGNRTFEGYMVLKNPLDASGGVRDFYQYSEIEYDSVNRIKLIRDPKADIEYDYDVVGNRRRVRSSYHDGLGGNRQTQEYWYTYDALNRFEMSMGLLVGPAATSRTDSVPKIELGKDGVRVGYDAASRRTVVINGVDGSVERYTYTADGYLEDTFLTDQGQAERLAARRVVDLAGRVGTYKSWSRDNQEYTRITEYTNDHRVASQSDNDGVTKYFYFADNKDVAGATSSQTNVDATARAHANGAGELARTLHERQGGATTNTYYAYDYWDEAKQFAITNQAYDPKLRGNNSLWGKGYSNMEYDENGHVKAAIDVVEKRSFRYVSNAQGLIMQRDEIEASKVNRIHRYYYVNGVRVGDVGNDGPTRTNYVQALANRGKEKPDYKNWKPIASADFDQNYEPISANYPRTAPSSYTVRGGDTLPSIAAALWGDRAMWYLIAEVNGLSGTEQLVEGQRLTIPPKVTNIHNNAGTFRVYDPAEAMGDLTPTLPPPPHPPRGGCGALGVIVMVVVAVVVSWMTYGVLAPEAGVAVVGAEAGAGAAVAGAGTAAGAGAVSSALTMQTVAAAAAAGAAGSVASQVVGKAIGAVDHFSWSGVALGAIGAGVGSGLGVAFGAATSMGSAAALGAAGNLITQGLAVATGLQKKFDWRGVAASALGSAAGYGIADAIGSAQYGNDWDKRFTDVSARAMIGNDIGGGFVRSAVSSLVNGGVRSAVQGYRPNWAAVAAESFGNSLGDAITEGIARRASQQRTRVDYSLAGADLRLGGSGSTVRLGSGDDGASVYGGGDVYLSRDQEERLQSGQTVTDYGDSYRGADGRQANSIEGVRRASNDRLMVDRSKLPITPPTSVAPPASGFLYALLGGQRTALDAPSDSPVAEALGRGFRNFTWTPVVETYDMVRDGVAFSWNGAKAGLGLSYDQNLQASSGAGRYFLGGGSLLGYYGEVIEGGVTSVLDLANAVRKGDSEKAAESTFSLAGLLLGKMRGSSTAATSRARPTLGNTSSAALSLEDTLVLRGDASRAQIVQAIGEAAQPSVKALLALDPEARVGFRGSLANGLKNDTKLGPNGERVPFDGVVATKNGQPYTGPQGYDADFFVVSDNLAAQLGNKPFFRNAARLDTSLNGIFGEFGAGLQSNPLLTGMKVEPPTFRVFTSTEIQKKLNAGDAQIYFIPGQP
ncbi:LysM peptidoglycan-binding domain-containing protein [Eleftheria terrae]|uniref:LysM peptidoglycan-binding domain-containing protein n=1 Tax=Eleftheria terrae TaxID=1597781 RepID=UPI00263B18E4|nr:LysM peptidoglycan-binding domain-containing protein [Eleftheria terrae]WKB56040.1 LysM peptidoglycan-binding domain-containing protein [Eleftheria terrae]